MSRGFADLFSEDHRDCFRVDESVRDLQVLEHSMGINFEAGDGFQHAMQGAGRQPK
jgi:hypothetical protein